MFGLQEIAAMNQPGAEAPVNTFTIHRPEAKPHKIFVRVSGGCAEVCQDTVPAGVEVEVVDFDNIEAGDSFPSAEAEAYFADETETPSVVDATRYCTKPFDFLTASDATEVSYAIDLMEVLGPDGEYVANGSAKITADDASEIWYAVNNKLESPPYRPA